VSSVGAKIELVPARHFPALRQRHYRGLELRTNSARAGPAFHFPTID
jgi:hypothetical protein